MGELEVEKQQAEMSFKVSAAQIFLPYFCQVIANSRVARFRKSEHLDGQTYQKRRRGYKQAWDSVVQKFRLPIEFSMAALSSNDAPKVEYAGGKSVLAQAPLETALRLLLS